LQQAKVYLIGFFDFTGVISGRKNCPERFCGFEGMAVDELDETANVVLSIIEEGLGQ
jgi:hypothetical protein